MPFLLALFLIGIAFALGWMLAKPNGPTTAKPLAVRSSGRSGGGAPPALAQHLVLNVLNRICLKVPDEHLQDGIDALADYLAAPARDDRQAPDPQQPLATLPVSYWALTEWLHDKPQAQWTWRVNVPISAPGRSELVGLLMPRLMAVEGRTVNHWLVESRPALSGQGNELAIQAETSVNDSEPWPSPWQPGGPGFWITTLGLD